MVEICLERKSNLSTLCAPMKVYPQLLKNVRVTDKALVLGSPKLQESIAKVEEALGNNGRILVRESGTEPLIRVMVEAETDELCAKHVDDVLACIDSILE